MPATPQTSHQISFGRIDKKSIQKSCRNLPETRKLGGKQAVLQDLEYTIVARPGARKHSKTKQIDAKFLPGTMPKASKNQAT